MPRKRTATVEETTTRRVTLTDEDADTITDYGGSVHGWAPGAIPGPLHWADGWHATTEERHLLRAQRTAQQKRAEELIADWAASVDPGTPMPQWLKDATTNMLRAGPHATPLQAKWGRDC